MDDIEHINDQLRQQGHAAMIKFAREAKSSVHGVVSPAQQHSFAVALAKQLAPTQQAVAPPAAQPKVTEHKGLEAGVVKITACLDNGDDTFSTKTVLVQGTVSS